MNEEEKKDDDDDYDDDNDENSDNKEGKNEIDDQLLLNILNRLMKNKTPLSNFLDSDHDDHGKFIGQKKNFLYPKFVAYVMPF